MRRFAAISFAGNINSFSFIYGLVQQSETDINTSVYHLSIAYVHSFQINVLFNLRLKSSEHTIHAFGVKVCFLSQTAHKLACSHVVGNQPV